MQTFLNTLYGLTYHAGHAAMMSHLAVVDRRFEVYLQDLVIDMTDY